MVALTALWLPILVSAVVVFLISSVIHMATPMHKGDQTAIPNEDALLDALRAAGAQRGHFRFPYAGSMADMASDEMKAKFRRGPVGVLTLTEGGEPTMGKELLAWFLYSVVISTVAGYVAGISLAPGAGFEPVLRITSAIALLTYCTSTVHESIWKGVPWAVALRFAIDGVLYAVATGVVFGWLWPGV